VCNETLWKVQGKWSPVEQNIAWRGGSNGLSRSIYGGRTDAVSFGGSTRDVLGGIAAQVPAM
jgi:hypothetical protein